MALDNAESLSDPFPAGSSHEPAPDSSPLRVSNATLLESGIPPARLREESRTARALAHELTLDQGVERMEAALSNVVRTEANLSLLVRGLKHLAAGAQAARAANTELILELDELRAHLTRTHDEEHALRFRMSQLEQLLDVVRRESSRERAFLIEQQDSFLVEILTDHDRQLDDLRQRLRDENQGKVDAHRLEELTAQRDQAREYATRCERERDLAWQELANAGAGAAAQPAPASPEPGRRTPSAATAIGSISLRSVSVPASESSRSAERPATVYSVSGEDVSE